MGLYLDNIQLVNKETISKERNNEVYIYLYLDDY
jgi:hypothetical protein